MVHEYFNHIMFDVNQVLSELEENLTKIDKENSVILSWTFLIFVQLMINGGFVVFFLV